MQRLALLGLGLILAATVASANTLAGGTGGMTYLFANETSLPSWTSSAIAWWSLDEDTTATRVSAGTCGSGCDMLPAGGDSSLPRDTSIKTEGAASATWGLTEDTYLHCTDANCSALERAGSGDHSLTVACAFYSTTATSSNNYIFDHMGGSSTGYQLQVSGGRAKAFLDGVEHDGPVTIANSVWNYVALVFDDSANTVKAYTNGATSGSAAVSAMTENAYEYLIGGQDADTTPAVSVLGKVDDCGVFAGAMSAESICRICSCGWDGSACKRIGTKFTSTGRNGSTCGSCTLPTDASASTP